MVGQSSQPMDTGKPDQTVLLMLSLHLILLAFFIVLNSTAQHHADKVAAAVDSLGRHFATGVPDRQVGMADEPGRDGGGLRRIPLLAALVERALPLARYTVFDDGGAMRLVVAADDLFVAGQATPTDAGAELLTRLSPLLADRSGGQKLEVEFVHPMRFALADALAAGEVLAIARAGAFARQLVDRGAPADSVLVGTRVAEPGDIHLWFTERSESRAVFDPARAVRMSAS